MNDHHLNLTFADSHAQNWGGIALRLVHYTPGIDSLRFGTNSSGLTTTQLGLMRFTDFLDVPGRIDANGFVTPVPPPTLSIVANGSTNVMLTWGSIDGRTYNIQRKTNPNELYWSTNFVQDVIATNGAASFTDNVGTNRNHYYRVLLRPVGIGI
jgi:hypothetical protein